MTPRRFGRRTWTGSPRRAADKTYDGINFVPYLSGENPGYPKRTLYWRSADLGQWAVLDGSSKLVWRTRDLDSKDAKAIHHPPLMELFDISQDISETNNLAASIPAEVKRLKAMLDKWEAQAGPLVFPGAGEKIAPQPPSAAHS
jgi:hypothetical protein